MTTKYSMKEKMLQKRGWVKYINFFFQAEDGIRDLYVTGVQTCALPISTTSIGSTGGPSLQRIRPSGVGYSRASSISPRATGRMRPQPRRSEERRVGKECRSRWSPYQ